MSQYIENDLNLREGDMPVICESLRAGKEGYMASLRARRETKGVAFTMGTKEKCNNSNYIEVNWDVRITESIPG